MSRRCACPGRQDLVLALGAALLLAVLAIAAALIISAGLPTIRIAGSTSERTIRPEDYGRRQVEGAARRWLLGWANSNAYNFPAHAATALAEVDDGLAERLRAYFADQARVFDALDRTTTARITAMAATALGDGVWEVSYTLSEHDFYGPVDTGDHPVSGRLAISTEHTGRSPALIIGFQPAS
jgi:hypothetical protein